MIFSDKATAHEVRLEAEKQLAVWIAETLITVRDVAKKTFVDLDDGTLHNFAVDQMRKMPPLVATLLFKSGIIHANSAYEGDKPHYPVNLFYDNDMEGGIGGVTEAIASSPGALVGGMVEGRIHT